MEAIPTNNYLEHLPGQLEKVRNIYGFQNSNQIDECIDILEIWIQKQNHFVKKDFDRSYLEMLLISCKGSTEKSKKMLDRLFTFRTIQPGFFDKFNVKEDFTPLLDNIYLSLMPKPTSEFYRVLVLKFLNTNVTKNLVSDLYKLGVHIAEYMKQFDYITGCCIIIDVRGLNVAEILPKFNPLELQKALTLFMEGYGMRIKGIHIVSTSILVSSIVALLKQAVSAKVAERIHIHQDVETLYEHTPKEILPKDLGGLEKPLRELIDEMVDVFSSKQRVAYMKELNKCGTDESRRLTENFNEQYLGMPGTFRRLNVD